MDSTTNRCIQKQEKLVMNNEKYNKMIDEAYDNYLKNFVTPICPPNLDVQPDYYMPMNQEWFVKSAKERGLRGEVFSQKWGLQIEERELSLGERKKLYEKEYVYTEVPNDHWLNSKLVTRKIPTRLITITYNNETIESYE